MKTYSKNQLRRYPVYLRVLRELEAKGNGFVSSNQIAQLVGNSEEQVKKDLAAVSDASGMPGRGRDLRRLVHDLEAFLGYHDVTRAVLVGAGRMGQALLDYPGFQQMGLDIVAAFDSDPVKIGTRLGETEVKDVATLEEFLSLEHPDILIDCVPASAAQAIADIAVRNKVPGIWNFAPTVLDVKESTIVENVNLASSLAVLSHRIKPLLS